MNEITDHKGQRIFRSHSDVGKIQEILAAPVGTTFLIGPKEYGRILELMITDTYTDQFSGGVPDGREGIIHMLNALYKQEAISYD